ncbi:MAG: hypothetical protein JXA20_06605 [Spirochaetes bacterium]|nr:hypothetical protein [Spirochaetota bacterium]
MNRRIAGIVASAVAAVALVVPDAMTGAHAQETLNILFTSNLEGRFNMDLDHQEKTDPMILMGQSLLYEQGRGGPLFLDLGNAFYPGLISRFYYGAPVMDFFNYMNCRTSLVSSSDLRLGVESLEFLQREGSTKLLSANIVRAGAPVFNPYIVEPTRTGQVAFVGLSSKKALIDVAEQKLFGIGLGDETAVLGKIIDELKEKKVSRIILLSGLEYDENMALLNRFSDIDLVVTGGDNKGLALGGQVVKIDTADGRSIVTVPPDRGYCVMSLSLSDDGVAVRDMSFRQPAYHQTDSQGYRNFIRRISLWKKQFLQESEESVVELPGKALEMDSQRVANLLRHRYRDEIALLGRDAVAPLRREGKISYVDVLSSVSDNYTIYRYRIKGSDLLAVRGKLEGFAVSGLSGDNKVQGYDVIPKRNYGIVSTQTGYEAIRKALGRDVPYRNTWETLPEAIWSDVFGDRAILRDDYRYLENRFRLFTDISLSLFYDNSTIRHTRDMTVPVGEPDESYYKWGVEGQVETTLYNSLHKLVFTPYINYSRQNETLQNNLLRGTLFYTLNLGSMVSPYHKLMAETVVSSVRGASSLPADLSTLENIQQYRDFRRMLRPTTLRQTLGANLQTAHFSGKAGFGYEKPVNDPVEPFDFGFEFSLKVTYDFLKYFNYTLNYDSFISVIGGGGGSTDQDYLRNELTNKLSVKITEELRLSLKHRWYYYIYLKTKDRYSNSQFITSFDLVTDFKI